jgi:tetraacyldisaccharide 4'-kinase
MTESLRDVPVVKCADRYAGGIFAFQSLKSAADRPFIFILDDGFQHWKLHRDRDVLLIDGLNPFGNRRLFPVGPLREPLRELRRADLFVVTKSRNEGVVEEIRRVNARAPVHFSEYKIAGLRNADGKDVPLETLAGEKIYAFCGIASPESFRMTLSTLGGETIGFKAYRDHYRYTQADIAYLEDQCRKHKGTLLLATEKDMVKLRQLKVPGNLFSLRIDFSVDRAFFDLLFGPA